MIPIKNAFRNNFKGEIVRNLELGNCFSVSATLCSNWVFTLQKEKVHVYKSRNSQGV